MVKQATAEQKYTNRLTNLSYKKWKTYLQVQKPYQWSLKRLNTGKTLDIGCGIGRYLECLPAGSVGIDHNEYSIKQTRSKGFIAYTTKGFKKSADYKLGSFDSLLLSHVLEHMTADEGQALIREYTPLLKSSGKLVVFCPQQKGYKSDDTHVTFLDSEALGSIVQKAGFKVTKSTSFPLPKIAGKLFTYNEFVVVGQKNGKINR